MLDLEKVFDNASENIMFEILEKTEVTYLLIIIKSLYEHEIGVI